MAGDGDESRLNRFLSVRYVDARARRSSDVDLDPVFGHSVEHSGGPFDHHDRRRPVDVEIVELRRAAEPVGVHVHKRCTATDAAMGAGEHERGARHRSAHPELVAETAGEGGLARPKFTVECHKIAGFELPGDPRPELGHVLWGFNLELHRSTRSCRRVA